MCVHVCACMCVCVCVRGIGSQLLDFSAGMAYVAALLLMHMDNEEVHMNMYIHAYNYMYT